MRSKPLMPILIGCRRRRRRCRRAVRADRRTRARPRARARRRRRRRRPRGRHLDRKPVRWERSKEHEEGEQARRPCVHSRAVCHPPPPPAAAPRGARRCAHRQRTRTATARARPAADPPAPRGFRRAPQPRAHPDSPQVPKSRAPNARALSAPVPPPPKSAPKISAYGLFAERRALLLRVRPADAHRGRGGGGRAPQAASHRRMGKVRRRGAARRGNPPRRRACAPRVSRAEARFPGAGQTGVAAWRRLGPTRAAAGSFGRRIRIRRHGFNEIHHSSH